MIGQLELLESTQVVSNFGPFDVEFHDELELFVFQTAQTCVEFLIGLLQLGYLGLVLVVS